MLSPTKKLESKISYFFYQNTRLSISSKGLNSCLAQSARKLWPWAKMAKVTFCGTWLPKFQIFGHNFWTRNTRCAIKGSKDLGHSLVSMKKLSQKIGSWHWHSGPGDNSQKGLSLPIMTLTRKKTKSKTFQLF